MGQSMQFIPFAVTAGDPSGSKDMGSGLQVAFDNQNRRVHLWRWKFQFWQDIP